MKVLNVNRGVIQNVKIVHSANVQETATERNSGHIVKYSSVK